MRKLFSPFWLLTIGAALAIATFGVLWFWPSGDYIFLPDQAQPVAPLVSVKGEHRPRDGGGIYFVDVIVRRARLIESLFPSAEAMEQILAMGQEEGMTLALGQIDAILAEDAVARR